MSIEILLIFRQYCSNIIPSSCDRGNTMRQKHNKVITEPIDVSILDDGLNKVKGAIMTIHPKSQHLINEWLNTWSVYIKDEKAFDPCRLISYKRGRILHVHFGYNVGSETGGPRYVVVVENNNPFKSKHVTVVPISTLGKEKSKDDIHHTEVFLGEVIPESGEDCVAQPIHIRTISKQRITKPKKSQDDKIYIAPELLDKIDEMIVKLFTKNKT